MIFILPLHPLVLASESIEMAVWPDSAPSSNGIPDGKEDMSNLDWVTGVNKATLTVFPSENPNGRVLLMCPGGAYAGLAMKHEGFDLAADPNAAGITLAVLKYRLPNGGHHEVPMEDAAEAMRILCRKADEWGIDPDKIGIGGASAGGHLASYIATHQTDSMTRPAFQVLIYPVITMCDEFTHGGSRDNLLGKQPTSKIIEYYSNEKHVCENTPPAFIVVSANDDIVPEENSINYFTALKNNGVPVALHVYPDGKHGWTCRPALAYHPLFIRELIFWINQL